MRQALGGDLLPQARGLAPIAAACMCVNFSAFRAVAPPRESPFFFLATQYRLATACVVTQYALSLSVEQCAVRFNLY